LTWKVGGFLTLFTATSSELHSVSGIGNTNTPVAIILLLYLCPTHPLKAEMFLYIPALLSFSRSLSILKFRFVVRWYVVVSGFKSFISFSFRIPVIK